MKKADLLSTLFVGIDVSSRSNVVALLDFESQKPLQTFTVTNNQPGAIELANRLADYLQCRKDLTGLVVGLESTSFMESISPITYLPARPWHLFKPRYIA